MQELVLGLLGVAVGFWLWYLGYRHGQQALPPIKPPPDMTPSQKAALSKALRERYNFLNFEGDEMKREP